MLEKYPNIQGVSAGDINFLDWSVAQFNLTRGCVALISVGNDENGDTLFKVIDYDTSDASNCRFVQVPNRESLMVSHINQVQEQVPEKPIETKQELEDPYKDYMDEYPVPNSHRDKPRKMKFFNGMYICKTCKKAYAPYEVKEDILDDIVRKTYFRCKNCGQKCVYPFQDGYED